MKTKISLIYIVIMGLALIFASCGSDEGDTTPPQINLIAPAEGAELVAGANLELVMDLADDEMLKSYKIEIHNNFNGHNHGGDYDHDHAKSLKSAEEATEPFAIQKTWSLSEKNVKVNHSEILIPEDATPGKYHLMIYCIDTSGNEAYVARNIVIVDKDHDHEHDH